ncbi:MAG: SDR family oxidoreductase [Pseudomonadota bacterium]
MSKILLVTGASRGIGAATARLAADQGYDVCVNYARKADEADAVADYVRAKGQRAITVQGDVSSEEDVLRLFQTADAELGRVSAFFNNAGVVDVITRLEDMSRDSVERMMAINITGSFLCAREAVRRMSTEHGGPGGAIVNMSSAAARLGGPNGLLHYAASKGAIDTFTRGLAEEVGGEGIRVNAVRPGIIETDIHDDMGVTGRVEQLGPTVPLGRSGAPEEVAQVVMWLLSDSASYCTGTIVDVSGGR